MDLSLTNVSPNAPLNTLDLSPCLIPQTNFCAFRTTVTSQQHTSSSCCLHCWYVFLVYKKGVPNWEFRSLGHTNTTILWPLTASLVPSNILYLHQPNLIYTWLILLQLFPVNMTHGDSRHPQYKAHLPMFWCFESAKVQFMFGLTAQNITSCTTSISK